MSLGEFLKHAFAVEPDGPWEPTPEQREPVEQLCRFVARRRLGVAATVTLEMVRPLNYVGSQAMHFFRPAISALASRMTVDQYRHLSEFLEHRGSIEYLCRRIEALEEEMAEQGGRPSTHGPVTDGSEADDDHDRARRTDQGEHGER